jgi:hypothetical protein
MNARRELILDADLPRSLRQELFDRHYEVENLKRLDADNLLDPAMLEFLANRRPASEFVLVTSDDRMPRVHGGVVKKLGVSIATIDGRHHAHPHPTQDHWRRDTVHRWAHSMATQQGDEIIRYTPYARAKWFPRKKK